MQTILIFGIQTVAGANIACAWSTKARVVGVADGTPLELTGVEILDGRIPGNEPARLLADVRPDLVLDASCCGDSPWNPKTLLATAEQCEQSAQRANACASLEIPFVLLSSDAVLTGPWMFHEEDSAYHCNSVVSQRLLKLETRVLETCPQSLVVRTHPIGWSPINNAKETGWLESLLEQARAGQPCQELCQPGYATPILASQLATLLQQAIASGLTGLYHIAGAERVNRLQFARRLTDILGVRQFRSPLVEGHFSRAERESFACGEMSLQTRKARQELGLSMPTLTESLEILNQQRHNGHLDRLCGACTTPATRAA